MSLDSPDLRFGPQTLHGRLRVAAIDRDRGFLQVLAKRIEALGWEHRVLPAPVSGTDLVAMRLNALLIDPAVIGSECWDYLEEVCGQLPGLAVVVCSGPSSVAQRVRGLRLGCDAWITKPCHPEEVVCVVEAAVRRYRRGQLPLEWPIQVGEVTIRSELHQAYVGELSVDLTAREFQILHLLAQSDRVLRREEIYERMWGYAMAHGDRSVDVFVRKLRQKLRCASPEWSYIHTHFGVGYRFAAEPDGDGDGAAERAAGEPELDSVLAR
jgi:DNA-binding response OmpR family regulator